MAPLVPKLFGIALNLVFLMVYLWRRARLGWRVDFADSAEEIIEFRGVRARVSHECNRYGWPLHAMVRFELADSWLFELSPQKRFHLDNEVTTGNEALDRRFFIAWESEHFARVLANSAPLCDHVLQLEHILQRYGARFGRLGCQGRNAAIKCDIRHAVSRPRLYEELADWMSGFDHLLQDARRSRPSSSVRSESGLALKLRRESLRNLPERTRDGPGRP